MAIPAYLWLKDDGGADIKGSVDVRDRVGSIEILGLVMACTSLRQQHRENNRNTSTHRSYI